MHNVTCKGTMQDELACALVLQNGRQVMGATSGHPCPFRVYLVYPRGRIKPGWLFLSTILKDGALKATTLPLAACELFDHMQLWVPCAQLRVKDYLEELSFPTGDLWSPSWGSARQMGQLNTFCPIFFQPHGAALNPKWFAKHRQTLLNRQRGQGG